MSDPVIRVAWELPEGEHATVAEEPGGDPYESREWLVTNGIGGYCSGTLTGVVTRRYHGLLVAALPSPFGRMMMLNHLAETVRTPNNFEFVLSVSNRASRPQTKPAGHREFRLELGLPVWTLSFDTYKLERRILMPHRQNTVHVTWTLLEGASPLELELIPWVHFRHHDDSVAGKPATPYALTVIGDRYELSSYGRDPRLRFAMMDGSSSFEVCSRNLRDVRYEVEQVRGYDAVGDLYSPGKFKVHLAPGQSCTFVASTEPWEVIEALSPQQAASAEGDRRSQLLERAPSPLRSGVAADLVMAADQFIIQPLGRVANAALARASGDDVRTVIAGYHWFTDWGRDTMISLEGLTLVTGRHEEAAWILRTFARFVRDGLIPNMFPDGQDAGLYHTADATLWFFHAIDRYVQHTGDLRTLAHMLPVLEDIVEHHLRGTRFGIAVDQHDGLLRQGEQGYQLTWMDAKLGDFVVTPRRGKAVELNGLWYNALRLLEEWQGRLHGAARAQRYRSLAEQNARSFNQRFWNGSRGYLFDVVDGDGGDDAACRPNQLIAMSLRYPVLDSSRHAPVLEAVRRNLLTPVGLRSLSPEHRDYQPRYFGDLRARDTAYHQGTVWAWLIGPYIDAWLRVHPDDKAGARELLRGFVPHLSEACIGSISEIFDATPPFTPRGCIAQAWSVAEVLRCWARTS